MATRRFASLIVVDSTPGRTGPVRAFMRPTGGASSRTARAGAAPNPQRAPTVATGGPPPQPPALS